MSRNSACSMRTMPQTHMKLNGTFSSVSSRTARISMVSPDHTCDSRSSSTATGGSPEGARGSLSQTMLRAGSTVVRIAALPSRSSRITGDETSIFSNWLNRMRTARDHSPPSRTHCTSAAGEGVVPRG